MACTSHGEKEQAASVVRHTMVRKKRSSRTPKNASQVFVSQSPRRGWKWISIIKGSTYARECCAYSEGLFPSPVLPDYPRSRQPRRACRGGRTLMRARVRAQAHVKPARHTCGGQQPGHDPTYGDDSVAWTLQLSDHYAGAYYSADGPALPACISHGAGYHHHQQ